MNKEDGTMGSVIKTPLPPMNDALALRVHEAIVKLLAEMRTTEYARREALRASWAARLRDAADLLNGPQTETIHNDSNGALAIEKRADGFHISVGINEAKAIALINSMRDERQPMAIVREDGSLLHAHAPRLAWVPTERSMAIDGIFDDIQLRALAWWIGERKR
jgi:hypothetical protein